MPKSKTGSSEPITITMTRAQALAHGLLRCTCGHPENNHFQFSDGDTPCAHCGCKAYDERIVLHEVKT